MLARGAALMLVAVMVAGCGRSQTDTTVLRVSNWGGAGDGGPFELMVQAKNREFGRRNNAEVRIEGIPGEYVPKMLLNFVAGAQPDIMIVDASSAAVFVNNGLLQDLTPFIESDPEFKLTDFYDNVLDTYAREEDGHRAIYAIPNDFTPMVMYYNKDLFDAAGVPYPKPGWSFDDFLATAKQLTDPSTKKYGFVFTNWMPGWVMWLWNNGGEVLSPDGRALGTFDSPKNVETFTFLRDLATRHRVAPTLSEAASMGVDPFAHGQAAMTVSGHWSLVSYKKAPGINWERLGVIELPHNTPESSTVLYMSAYGIPRGAKNPELAWKYIKMWASRDVQVEYQSTGIAVCARLDVSHQRAGLDNPRPNAEQLIEQAFLPIILTGRPPTGSRIEGYEIVEKLGASAMQSILNGADVAKTLRSTATRLDAEFAKSRPQ